DPFRQCVFCDNGSIGIGSRCLVGPTEVFLITMEEHYSKKQAIKLADDIELIVDQLFDQPCCVPQHQQSRCHGECTVETSRLHIRSYRSGDGSRQYDYCNHWCRSVNFVPCDGILSQKQENPITLVDDQTKYALALAEKIEISHDTRKFRFRLPSENHVLGLPTGQHVYLSAKVYFRGVNPKFPDGGKMSQHLEQMKIGGSIEFRGPSGLIVYKGNGKFAIRADKKAPPKERVFKSISMIAGGTGITPMLQIISAILKSDDDNTHISLLFANQSEEDILCRKELDELALKHSDRFKVWYTVDRPPTNWNFSSGFINDQMIKEHLWAPSDDSAVFLCGPPPMINFACIPNLDKLAYDPNNRFQF
ncbi:hypothetical protein Y032_0044g902, partial [Ancylostoma ceylanicum]